jgi:ribosomal protein S12 methylthiotransferase
LRRMRRWGDGPRFLARIRSIRELLPDAAFRSSFIVGYPGETESDHDQLLSFVADADLDWAGFFPFSPEAGTYAVDLDGQVEPALVAERLAEVSELQDRITAAKRDDLVGASVEVLVDGPGVGRSHREAPEIDGIITIPERLATGAFATVTVTGAAGPDLEAA